MEGGLIEALSADGSATGAEEELATFGQFVGDWEVEVIYHEASGTVTRTGEWVFGWTLEGRAIQDVWRVPASRDAAPSDMPLGYGTTFRFFDLAIGAWRSTWHGLVKGEVIAFIGRPVGGEIQLEDRSAPPAVRRWTFSTSARTASIGATRSRATADRPGISS